MNFRYDYPVDPDCPDVAEYYQMADDPIMASSGCWGEFRADFDSKHRSKCKRCQEYGAANVDVV